MKFRGRIIAAVITATAITGSVFGLAASLDLASNNLGVGTEAVAACQSDLIGIGYEVDPSGNLISVDLEGLQDGCILNGFTANLFDGDTLLGAVSGMYFPPAPGYLDLVEPYDPATSDRVVIPVASITEVVLIAQTAGNPAN